MPILNMNYSKSGGANIGEPLNLTVTTSGLNATIKWEDNEIGTIPPTTFQKSELVRKIGSAPTSPSDGTLVVTETVKDTYKTTGYVDPGLEGGTTYYYRVFSYSDLGGISYCDAVDITTSTPLPTEYQEVERIESDGSQIINTGYITNSSIKMEIEFMLTSSAQDQVLFGTTLGNWSWTDCLAFSSGNGHFEVGASSSVWWNISVNVKHTLDYTLSSVSLDGDAKNYSASVPGTNTLTIFYGNGKGGYTRIYTYKIYTGTTLEREFVPCYRKQDSEIGLYDKVNAVFYTNSGSGTFTKGNDVN